jgi:hypothetical protein
MKFGQEFCKKVSLDAHVKTTCDACLTIQDGLTVDRADTYNYAVIA